MQRFIQNCALGSLGFVTYKLLLNPPKDLEPLKHALRGIQAEMKHNSYSAEVRNYWDLAEMVGTLEYYRLKFMRAAAARKKRTQYKRLYQGVLEELQENPDYARDVKVYGMVPIHQRLGAENRRSWLKLIFVCRAKKVHLNAMAMNVESPV